MFLAACIPLFIIFKPKILSLTEFESNNLIIFISFFFYTIVLNLVYLIVYPNGNFYETIFFYTFNMFGIIIFTYLIKDKEFLKSIYQILSFNIIVQVIILFLNRGRYLGDIRYMGTFNDPNQFSFYIFLSIISVYVIEDILSLKSRRWLIYLLGGYLIISSASTGILLGITIFFISLLFTEFKISKLQFLNSLKIIALFGILGAGIYFAKGDIVTQKFNYLSTRIEEKLNSTKSNAEITLAEERGYDKIYKNAEYLIFGSGEGEMGRLKGFSNSEVHATFPGLFLYYGIPGLFLISLWLYKSLARIPLNLQLIFMALFVESLTLANQRQFLFWGVIILMSKVRKGEGTFHHLKEPS